MKKILLVGLIVLGVNAFGGINLNNTEKKDSLDVTHAAIKVAEKKTKDNETKKVLQTADMAIKVNKKLEKKKGK